MKTNNECEYKLLINEKEYDILSGSFLELNAEIEQINYYFDTNELDLKNNNITLRVRLENNEYILTWKQKVSYSNKIVNSEEYSKVLSEEDFNSILFDPKLIICHLKQLEITEIKHENFILLGKMENLRREFMVLNNKCHLDKTYFPRDIINYELEIENINDVQLLEKELRDLGIYGDANGRGKYNRFIEYADIKGKKVL
jgi:uncharacterized protein YjbK